MSRAADKPVRDPREARAFRFVRCSHADGVAELVYAFDDGPELVERVRFPGTPPLSHDRGPAFDAALRMLHLFTGISYYKAGLPPRIEVETGALDEPTAELLDALYLHGLAEFAYRNGLDLRGRIAFPRAAGAGNEATASPCRPGGSWPWMAALGRDQEPETGKGSRRALEPIGVDATATWVGASPLIASVAARTGLPMLNIGRELSPVLFDYNRMGAWNGHIPVTAINSAILACAAILHGFDAIVFANERSASAATLEYEGQQVNHQWSKGWAFEQMFAALLRSFAELAVTRAFAKGGAAYFDVFSSCNRNFRILGPQPADRWCGQCPKCHFVFLALAPFLPKPRLLSIFGRNLLDDESLAPGFDALIEYRDHKPFECVGEGAEARAAFADLAGRPEWREDALVARFREEIAPRLDAAQLALAPWLVPSGEHGVPERFHGALDAIRGA